MSSPITIELPWPPSVNAMYANRSGWRSSMSPKSGSGRFAAKKYRMWKREADQCVMMTRVRPLAGPVSLEIKLHPSDNRRQDADNRVKPLLDCLVRMSVLADDSQEVVRGVHVKWGEVRRPAAAIVTITPEN